MLVGLTHKTRGTGETVYTPGMSELTRHRCHTLGEAGERVHGKQLDRKWVRNSKTGIETKR